MTAAYSTVKSQSASATIAYGAMVGAIVYPISLGLGFAWNAVLTRALPPQEVGVYAIGMTILSVGAILANMGMASAVGRYLPLLETRADVDGVRYLVWIALMVPLLGGLLVGAILFANMSHVERFLHMSSVRVLLFVSLAIPFQGLFSSVIKIFLANCRPFISQGLSVLALKLFPAVILALTFGVGMRGNAADAVGIVLVCIVVIAIIGIALVHKRVVRIVGRVAKRTVQLREIFIYSMPLTLSGVFAMTSLWTDTIMLGALIGGADVAYYNMSYLLATLIRTLAFALPQILLMPVMMRKYAADDHQGIRNVYGGVARTVFLSAVPLACFLFFFSNGVLGTLFGSAYVMGSGALKVLASMFLLSVSLGHCSTVIGVYGKTGWIFSVSLIALMANMAGNYMLIPAYGVTGAALATGGAEVLRSILLFVRIPAEFRAELPVVRMILLLATGGILFGGLDAFLDVNRATIIPVAFLGFVLFGCAAWFAGLIRDSDKRIYVSVVKDWLGRLRPAELRVNGGAPSE